MARLAVKMMGVILTDKGSKYAVSGCAVSSRAEIDAALAELTREKRYAKATHNMWGAVLSAGGAIKADDGESGAGSVILRVLEGQSLMDHLVIVTRWYGGKKLGGDRFRHVRTCTSAYVDALRL